MSHTDEEAVEQIPENSHRQFSLDNPFIDQDGPSPRKLNP